MRISARMCLGLHRGDKGCSIGTSKCESTGLVTGPVCFGDKKGS